MKDKYKYFVSYFYQTGVAARIFTTNKKITSFSDLKLVEADILADGEKNPVIVNFILLDTKWGFWEWFSAIAEMATLVLCILALIASFFV